MPTLLLLSTCGTSLFTHDAPAGLRKLLVAHANDHERDIPQSELASRAYGAPSGARYLARELGRLGALARPALPGSRFVDPKGIEAHDRETVIIDDRWLDLTEHMRRRVLHELICRGIVVESCPTSNLVVPNLDGEPPLLALTKETGLSVALATDNPGLMACYPRSEMSMIADEGDRRRLLKIAAEASFVWQL